ncbi:MAG TPA: AraC family transcriptional regulator [Thermoanaerobaculia bacterium]|jgi:AraC family transcriptional regulator|nr:AraC family transcriptional regulator [Thermoanaerobaculia bacterium]
MTAPAIATLGQPDGVIADDGFAVAVVTYPPSALYEPHTHASTYVALTLTGHYDVEAGGAHDVAPSASAVMTPAGIAHANRIAPSGARAMVVTFAPSASGHAGGLRILHGGDGVRILLRLYRAYRLAEVDTMRELLWAFGDSIGPDAPQAAASSCVRAASAILRTEFCERLRLRQVAARVGVDPASLARAFRRAHGTTMGEHLRMLRANRAAELLASSRMPLAEVALAAGFADQSHLCRVFRAAMGFSPLAYRTLLAS